MDIGLLLKVAGVGVLVTVCCQILNKAGRDEYSLLVSLTGIVLIFLLLVGEIGALLEAVRTVFGL